jgi:hypothetical protein
LCACGIFLIGLERMGPVYLEKVPLMGGKDWRRAREPKGTGKCDPGLRPKNGKAWRNMRRCGCGVTGENHLDRSGERAISPTTK